MADKETVIKRFIANFLLKNRTERSYLELMDVRRRGKFIGRFNHDWESILKMIFTKRIPKEFDYPRKIQEMLQFEDDELCYVISHDDNYDDHFLKFKDVFEKVYARGTATIIVNMSASTMFLDTEQMQGPAPRFIGVKE
jgi:hypothetical protein